MVWDNKIAKSMKCLKKDEGTLSSIGAFFSLSSLQGYNFSWIFWVVCFIFLYPEPEPYSEYGPVLETPNEYGSDRFRFRLRNPAKDTRYRYCIVKASILLEFYEILGNFSNRDFTDWQGILLGLSFQREVPFYLATGQAYSLLLSNGSQGCGTSGTFPTFCRRELGAKRLSWLFCPEELNISKSRAPMWNLPPRGTRQ